MHYESPKDGMNTFNEAYGQAATPLIESLALQYEAVTQKAPASWIVQQYENGLVLLRAMADDHTHQRQLDRLDCGSMFMKAAANVYSVLSEHDEETDLLETLQLGSVRKVGAGRIATMIGWRSAWQGATNSQMRAGS
ncbi:hypothetical protein HB728_27655 [Pseudomonas aeruginosa]|uniref:hypothetical protein n=1 Tax=Pseudomonas aeruginosa TaxID=287 RepID=UPI00155E4E8B|nr:hypothetical protein [Pseudomonas aeruginosa]NRC26604.1 hypothetical protein [Pseudomonas aeruginosa]